MTATPSLPRAALCLFLSVALALGAPAHALGPFEKNHPLVQEGAEAYERGDYETALARFEGARKELPNSPALEFNRGSALYKLGRHEEAKAAFRRAAEADKGTLRQKDLYNLGNTLAAMGDKEGAVAAYRKALTLDPKDQRARHNLEVMLRDLKSKKQGPDGGAPDAGSPDAGADGGRDGGVDGGQDGGTDGGQDAGQDGGRGGPDGGRDGGDPRQGGDAGFDGGSDGGSDGGRQKEGSERRDGGEQRPEELERDGGAGGQADGGQDGGTSSEHQLPDGGVDLSRREAEKLLDSLKNTEKNLQLWRFQQKRSRKPNDKDW